MKRKMLAAREDVALRMREIATQRGMTLYGLVNDALESVIRMDEMGIPVSDVMEEYRALNAAKKAGFLLCPESLWYEMVEQAHAKDNDGMAEKWLEAGDRVAQMYKVRESQEPLAAFKRDIRNFTWNAFEFSFDEGQEILVRCIGPKFPEAYAVLFSRFLEGSFHAFGYQCVERDAARGALQLRLVRERPDAQA